MILFIIFFNLERDIKLPLALQRCLMGFKDGMLLFQFVMRQATNVIRQKAFVYGLDGQSTGTILEVSFIRFGLSSPKLGLVLFSRAYS